jgi:hypothetical protein
VDYGGGIRPRLHTGSTDWIAPIVFLITCCAERIENAVSNNNYCCRGMFTDPLLRNGLHYIFVPLLPVCMLRELAINDRYIQSRRLATGLYATIYLITWMQPFTFIYTVVLKLAVKPHAKHLNTPHILIPWRSYVLHVYYTTHLPLSPLFNHTEFYAPMTQYAKFVL